MAVVSSRSTGGPTLYSRNNLVTCGDNGQMSQEDRGAGEPLARFSEVQVVQTFLRTSLMDKETGFQSGLFLRLLFPSFVIKPSWTKLLSWAGLHKHVVGNRLSV